MRIGRSLILDCGLAAILFAGLATASPGQQSPATAAHYPVELSPLVSRHTDSRGQAHPVLLYRVIYSDGVAILATPQSDVMRDALEQMASQAVHQQEQKYVFSKAERAKLHLASELDISRFLRRSQAASEAMRQLPYTTEGETRAHRLMDPLVDTCRVGVFAEQSLLARVSSHVRNARR